MPISGEQLSIITAFEYNRWFIISMFELRDDEDIRWNDELRDGWVDEQRHAEDISIDFYGEIFTKLIKDLL